MGEYWESATKEIRERLEDPLLKVEVETKYEQNLETGIWERKYRYEVLKLMPDGDYIQIVVDGKLIVIAYEVWHWAHQKWFDIWDGRVEKEMIATRPGRSKEIKKEQQKKIESKKREWNENAGAMGQELGHDLYHRFHPRIISTA